MTTKLNMQHLMEHSVSRVYALAGCTVLDVVLSDTTNMSRGKQVKVAMTDPETRDRMKSAIMKEI